MSQLALPLTLQDHAVFDSFLATGNEPVVAFLQDIVETGSGPGGWLWGPSSTGKTHLLQAVCERAGDRAQFVPMSALKHAVPGILDGLENRQFVCIDDVDQASGSDDWEFGLFSLINSLLDAGGMLICSAMAPPRECGFRLADLGSRFAKLPIFYLGPLDEAARMEALKLRARHRGLELPTETASFLLTRSRRDMTSLYGILDTLDAAALKAQRRLTVPFVRQVLQAAPDR